MLAACERLLLLISGIVKDAGLLAYMKAKSIKISGLMWRSCFELMTDISWKNH